MRVAAYCRVSTEKDDQLNSLDAQKSFFCDYCEKNGHTLVTLYADEGISGTKIKNRTEFQRMMSDAETGLFETVIVKDISRFARNTVDLLQSIRKLRSIGIETNFITANMNTVGNSEFVLTVFAALAQEESANTSKRVKFGKSVNAKKGRVPNLVFGYDKTPGNYFELEINPSEAETVKQIYSRYLNDGIGMSKIASLLNSEGVTTKRGYQWSQNAVNRILDNELYTGKIINAKEEVADFLTGKRVIRDVKDWYITSREELRIISEDDFFAVQKQKQSRADKFKNNKERHSNKHLFSTLIKCKCCNHSFRRIEGRYKTDYIKWTCSYPSKFCSNRVNLDEQMLITELERYFIEIISHRKDTISCFRNALIKSISEETKDLSRINELNGKIQKLQKNRSKYMDMYINDLINRNELESKLSAANKMIAELENELSVLARKSLSISEIRKIVFDLIQGLDDIVVLKEVSNTQLKSIIEKIEVDSEGNTVVYIKNVSNCYCST